MSTKSGNKSIKLKQGKVRGSSNLENSLEDNQTTEDSKMAVVAESPTDVPKMNFDDMLNNFLDSASKQEEELQISLDKAAEKIDPSTISLNQAQLTATRKTDSFTVTAFVTAVNQYDKKALTGEGTIKSYIIMARLSSGSINEETKKASNIEYGTNDSGFPVFRVRAQCDLSKKKKDAQVLKKGTSQAQKQQESAEAQLANVATPQQQQSSVTVKQPGNTGTKRQADVDSSVRKKQRVSENENLQEQNSNSGKAPFVEEPVDYESSLSNSAMVRTDSGTELLGDSGSITSDSAPVYFANEIEGTEYLGRPVTIIMDLPINTEILFGIDDKEVTNPPPVFSLVTMEIRANPYVTATLKYTAYAWTICQIKKYEAVSASALYRIGEAMCQNTRYRTLMYLYLDKIGSFKNEKDQTSNRFNKDNCYWIVVGNEYTYTNPLNARDLDNDPTPHAYFVLTRETDITKFSKVDSKTSVTLGTIPYSFNCLQWFGNFTDDNPTIMKFETRISVNWKHISLPSTSGKHVYTLGITSHEAWLSLIPAIYPHIKAVLITNEDAEAAAQNVLNYNRYTSAKAAGNVTLMNKPYLKKEERLQMAAFRLNLVISKCVLLPLHTLKSIGIRITHEYLTNPHYAVWNSSSQIKAEDVAPTKWFKGANQRPSNGNDLITCLSEVNNVSELIRMHIQKTEILNFYAVINVYFKSSIKNDCMHRRLSPEEGVVYLQALRNIVSKGGHASCFLTPRNPVKFDPVKFNGSNTQEKYVNYLREHKVKQESELYKVDVSDLKITGDESLCVYFYAVRASRDDAPSEQGKILYELLDGTKGEAFKMLVDSASKVQPMDLPEQQEYDKQNTEENLQLGGDKSEERAMQDADNDG